jgi:hypothetical protein
MVGVDLNVPLGLTLRPAYLHTSPNMRVWNDRAKFLRSKIAHSTFWIISGGEGHMVAPFAEDKQTMSADSILGRDEWILILNATMGHALALTRSGERVHSDCTEILPNVEDVISHGSVDLKYGVDGELLIAKLKAFDETKWRAVKGVALGVHKGLASAHQRMALRRLLLEAGLDLPGDLWQLFNARD